MELVEVEITGQAITARYGTLNTGDILRTDAEFAKHLVEDCAAAKYTKAKPVKVPAKAISPAEPATRKRRASVAAAPAIDAVQGAVETAPEAKLLDAAQDAAAEETPGDVALVAQPAVDAVTA